MGYENEPYRDEEGEPLMDYDGVPSDREQSPEPKGFYDDLEEDLDDWRNRERSQTPIYEKNEASASNSKPRKRLIKKGDSGKQSAALGLVDEEEEEEGGLAANFVRDGSEDRQGGKRKRGKESASIGKMEKSKGEKKFGTTGKSKLGLSKEGFPMGGSKDDGEVKEMWDTIAGGDSEDDGEGPRTVDDDNFIDDSGLDPADRFGIDHEHSPSRLPQAEEGEEDEEINNLFKVGKKRKKNERNPADIALLVENIMAELEVTAEEDAELNRQGQPAINKLKKLNLLTDVLTKKQLQQEFLDHGVLTLLKNWLEPLPDGSLPNITIRTEILRILNELPIDLEQYDRREQLKKSGLGKVIMFLSKTDEEIGLNRKLAKELVDKWSRHIFNKSTRFEDMRHMEHERAPYRRPSAKKPANKASVMESRDGDFDLDEFSQRKSSQSSSRQHASRPEATPLDFVVRPQSKIDPEEIRARAKQAGRDQHRVKMNKKLHQLRAPKKKQLQATKLSAEGRGMLKYL